jgi:alpha-1,3-glucosyltransferase
LLASLPSLINLLINPHPKRLIYSLSIVSLSFFLLSFQVHEKTILLPLLPITMLTVDERKISQWFTNVATFR